MSEIDEPIDGLTSSIVHQSSGQVFPTTIAAYGDLAPNQRAALVRWRFDWSVEVARTGRDVVALLAGASDIVQGLMSMETAKGFILVHLLESAPHNVGQNKLYRGIPGNLFAYASSRSFALGFDGFVAFEAKTELIEHYKLSLGAEQVGSSSRMIIAMPSALELVKQYFQEADRWPL